VFKRLSGQAVNGQSRITVLIAGQIGDSDAGFSISARGGGVGSRHPGVAANIQEVNPGGITKAWP
jgi:hypothetical protein